MINQEFKFPRLTSVESHFPGTAKSISFARLFARLSAMFLSRLFPREASHTRQRTPDPDVSHLAEFCEMGDARHSPARPRCGEAREMGQNRANFLVFTGAFPLESIRLEGNK